MKTSVYSLFFLFFLSLVWTACEEETEGLTEINTPAPANVDASINVSNDNSGEVTFAPGGDNVASFQVTFGDGSDPVSLIPGKSVTHTYEEGTYTASIIGFGLDSTQTVDVTKEVSVIFAPPQNLAVDVAVDNRSVTVTPSADDASRFEVSFNETEQDTAVSIQPGESASRIYAEVGEYVIEVEAFGAGAATSVFTDTVQLTESIELPITFEEEGISYDAGTFGGAVASVESNPDASGANTSATVGKIVRPNGAQNFAGSTLELGTPIDFANFNVMKLKVYAPRAGTNVLLKVENLENPDLFAEVNATTTTANEWEELFFDFSGIDTSIDYGRVVLFFDLGTEGDGSEYFYDDIELTNVPINLPLNFEQGTESFTNFQGAVTTIIPNPDPTGLNTSSRVANTNKGQGAATFAGSFVTLEQPIDFSNGTTFSIKTWSPKVGDTVKLRLENLNDGAIGIEVDQTTTVANEWEELTYDFSGEDLTQDYQKVVLFFDFGNPGDGSDYYFDDVVQSSSGPQVELPVNFENSELEYDLFSFEGAADSLIANPDASGINTSGTVVEVEKTNGAATFAGTILTLDQPIDLSAGTTFSLKTWSPKAGATVRLKVENADASEFFEADATTSVTNQWEELTWDFSGASTTASFNKVIVFFDFGNGGDGSIYYYDDIQLVP